MLLTLILFYVRFDTNLLSKRKKDMKQVTLKISLFFNNLLFMYAFRCLILVTHFKYNAYQTWWTSILVSSSQRLTWNAIASFWLAYTINCLRNTSAVALTVNWSDISAAHITCVMNEFPPKTSLCFHLLINPINIIWQNWPGSLQCQWTSVGLKCNMSTYTKGRQ